MTNKTRDDHLATLLPADVLKELDSAERNVLYEDFSNNDVRQLGAQGLEPLRRRISGNLTTEFQRRLNQIAADEYESLKPWYLKNCHTVEEIYCLKCGALEGIQVDTIDDNTNEHHHEGKFVVAIGNSLLSYRPRLDGVIGFLCGNITDVPKALIKETEEDYQKQKDARRIELTEQLTEQLTSGFEEAEAKGIEEAIADENFPKVNTKAKAKKHINYKKPTKEDIEGSVNVVLETEFPPLEFKKKMECGNNTLWSQIELEIIPEEHGLTSISKEDIVKLKQKMDETNYSPDVEETKSGTRVETFELRKVK